MYKNFFFIILFVFYSPFIYSDTNEKIVPASEIINKKELKENNNTFFYNEQGKRDPFAPLIGKIKDKGKGNKFSDNTIMLGSRIIDICLEGILWDKKRASFAIINDEVLSKGDSIQGITITYIGRNFIKITDGNYSTKIFLKEEII